MNPATISVVITGAPSNFRKPKTLPGESMEQFTIRTNPDHWRNCIGRMERELGLPTETCDRLRQGDINVNDSRVSKEIHKFMSWRWPHTGRTLESLAEVRAALINPKLCVIAETETHITQILLPKTPHASNDEGLKQLCNQYNAEVIWITLEEWSTFFAEKLLPKVRGDFFWMVPAVTRVRSPMLTGLQITRIMSLFSKAPTLAMFFDNGYTRIGRVEAIRDILIQGRGWPNDPRECAKRLDESGYKSELSDLELVELEELYGGNASTATAVDETRPSNAEKPPLWTRLFGA